MSNVFTDIWKLCLGYAFLPLFVSYQTLPKVLENASSSHTLSISSFVCQLPNLAKGLGKRQFKSHLEHFFLCLSVTKPCQRSWKTPVQVTPWAFLPLFVSYQTLPKVLENASSSHTLSISSFVCQLPNLAKGLGKRQFKSHLEHFLEPIFYSLVSFYPLNMVPFFFFLFHFGGGGVGGGANRGRQKA